MSGRMVAAEFLSPVVDHSSSTIASGSPLVVTYMGVAVLTAFAYDWILSLADEVQVARTCGLKLSVLAYFLSRTGIMGMCIMSAMLPIATIAHCQTLFRLEELTAIVGTSATSFLFFVRVRAVYGNSKVITAFFGCFWLVIAGTSFLQLVSSQASSIGATEHCIVSKIKPWMMVFLWAKAAYDTSIFIAISFRIASQSIFQGTPNRSVMSILRGHGLSRLGKDLLHSGQLYYFVTIGVTLFAACIAAAPVSPIYRGYFAEPALALESNMACRVFRAVILGSRKEMSSRPASMVLTTFVPPDSEESWPSSDGVSRDWHWQDP